MPRRQASDGMEQIYQDFNKLSAAMEKEFYDRVLFRMLQQVENAFFDTSFKASFSTSTQINVNGGLGFQTDGAVSSPEPTKRLLYKEAATTLNLEAPDLANDRIDIVLIKHNRATSESESRKYKAPITNIISNVNFPVENDWAPDISILAGTPAGSPVAPATPAGYLKIAELYVTAVTGMSGSGAVTDNRTLLPVGGTVALDTTGKVRVTAGASVPLSTLITDIDTLLKFGYQNYTDFDELGADPSAPGAGKVRMYHKGGVFFFRQSSGTILPIGSSGGGGGGGGQWVGTALEADELALKIKRFAQGDSNKEVLMVQVPTSYIAGRQLKMKIGSYTPSTSNQYRMRARTFLLQNLTDAVDDTTDVHQSDSANITAAAPANKYTQLSFDLTDATGLVNSVPVLAGHVLRVELTRIAPTGSEDTEDTRIIPVTTEVLIT